MRNTRSVLTLILVMLFVFGCLSAYAEKPGIVGNITLNTLRVPSQYPTIQAAIDAASYGDLVLVNDGTYVETINFLGKAITVRSVNGPQNTKIVAPGYSHAVIMESGETQSSVLEGFYIRTYTAMAKAIYCSSSSPLITKNVICSSYSGIFCTDNSSPMILNNTIVGVGYVGYTMSAIYWEYSSPTIKNNIIVGSNGGLRSNGGGGAFIDYNNVWDNVNGGYISSQNYSGCSAGPNDISEDPMFAVYEINVSEGESIQEAIDNIPYLLGEGSPCIGAGEGEVNIGAYPDQGEYGDPGPRTIIVETGDFSEDILMPAYCNLIGSSRNNSRILGTINPLGSQSHIANLTIIAQVPNVRNIDTIFSFNSIIEDITIIGGSYGIHAGEFHQQILHNSFFDNTMCGIDIPWRGSDIEIKNNKFVNCWRGIFAGDLLGLSISNNIIIGCTNQNGYAIKIAGFPNSQGIKIVNNVIIDGQGGGIGIASTRNLEDLFVENNIIMNNQGLGIYTEGQHALDILIDYNDVWNNTAGNYGGYAEPGLNDISENPLFVDQSNNKYYLMLNSPCVDAGNPDPMYNDPDNTRNDMGAYGGPQAQLPDIIITEPKHGQVLHTLVPDINWYTPGLEPQEYLRLIIKHKNVASKYAAVDEFGVKDPVSLWKIDLDVVISNSGNYTVPPGVLTTEMGYILVLSKESDPAIKDTVGFRIAPLEEENRENSTE